ncbi:hypothetical protein C8J57DRAFT_1706966 [Mycena rebaudengoi]|nr:hypothetical protein C8J57DRAFT_1706966 [Mycena rebaudengoi]
MMTFIPLAVAVALPLVAASPFATPTVTVTVTVSANCAPTALPTLGGSPVPVASGIVDPAASAIFSILGGTSAGIVSPAGAAVSSVIAAPFEVAQSAVPVASGILSPATSLAAAAVPAVSSVVSQATSLVGSVVSVALPIPTSATNGVSSTAAINAVSNFRATSALLVNAIDACKIANAVTLQSALNTLSSALSAQIAAWAVVSVTASIPAQKQELKSLAANVDSAFVTTTAALRASTSSVAASLYGPVLAALASWNPVSQAAGTLA